MRRANGICALIGAAAITVVISPAASAAPPTASVATVAFRFVSGENYVVTQQGTGVPWPNPLRITRGTNLVLTNYDQVPHTLTSDGCADGKGFADPSPPAPLG